MKFVQLYAPLVIILLTGCSFDRPNAGQVRISEVDGMEMIFIPAGEFGMGSESDDPRADEDELPLHTVYLDAFWIDKSEVTNAMYVKCIGIDACTPPARSTFYSQPAYADHPVLGVSWNQANVYCAWADRRLPSEAEWEKAARGTDERIYPWGNADPTSDLVNFNQNMSETTPVGSYPHGASPYGALDMAGNVWEWTLDGYDIDYYLLSGLENPISESPINRRVLRGGNWNSNADGIRATNRFWAFPGRNDTDGFRCAKSH